MNGLGVGQITIAGDPRRIQFGLKSIIGRPVKSVRLPRPEIPFALPTRTTRANLRVVAGAYGGRRCGIASGA